MPKRLAGESTSASSGNDADSRNKSNKTVALESSALRYGQSAAQYKTSSCRVIPSIT
jgi:hypothetical protein